MYAPYKQTRDSRPVANVEIYKVNGDYVGIVVPHKARERVGQLRWENVRDDEGNRARFVDTLKVFVNALGYRYGRIDWCEGWT